MESCGVRYWDALSAGEIDALRLEQRPPTVLLPLGVAEAHGPFMPLWFDAKIAQLITQLVAERIVRDGYKPIVFDRTAYCGIVCATCELPGTVPCDAITTTELLFQSIRGLYNGGMRNFCIINGDGGTGNQWRGLLFYAEEKRREFFCSWEGSLSFITWFEGIDGLQGHASSYEHAWLKYVCDLADDHTRKHAHAIGLSAHLLTEENLKTIDGSQRIYPKPRQEFVSWKRLSDEQVQTFGVSSFSLDEYNTILESGAVQRMWEKQLDMVYRRIHNGQGG